MNRAAIVERLVRLESGGHDRPDGEPPVISKNGLSAILVDGMFGAGLLTPPSGPTEGLLHKQQQEWRRAKKRRRVTSFVNGSRHSPASHLLAQRARPFKATARKIHGLNHEIRESHERLRVASQDIGSTVSLRPPTDESTKDRRINKCRLSLRERTFFRGAKDDNRDSHFRADPKPTALT